MEDIEVKITILPCKTVKFIQQIIDGKPFHDIGNAYYYTSHMILAETKTYKKMKEKKEHYTINEGLLYNYIWGDNGICLIVTKYKNDIFYGKHFERYESDSIQRVFSFEEKKNQRFDCGWYRNGILEYEGVIKYNKNSEKEDTYFRYWSPEGKFLYKEVNGKRVKDGTKTNL
jgi:antitoxin component YwqK of YwqJK toxin-antitoxin module